MSAEPRSARGWRYNGPGHYWQRGDYIASTIATGDRSRSGYILGHLEGPWQPWAILGEFLTWDEVEHLADRRKGERRRMAELAPSGV